MFTIKRGKGVRGSLLPSLSSLRVRSSVLAADPCPSKAAIYQILHSIQSIYISNLTSKLSVFRSTDHRASIEPGYHIPQP